MTVEFVYLSKTMTAKRAMEIIRKNGLDKETIYTCYVIDDKKHLVGVLPLRTLLFADEDKLVEELMEEDVISIATLDDQEEAANLFRKYSFISLPVVDGENRLVGIITVDDIVDVIDEETTEDMEKMAALLPSDEEYLKTPVTKLARNRIVWLCVLMISGTLSSAIISGYDAILSQAVQLAAFIPVLTGTGRQCRFPDLCYHHSWDVLGGHPPQRYFAGHGERNPGRYDLRCPSGGTELRETDHFQPFHGYYGGSDRFCQHGLCSGCGKSHGLRPAHWRKSL